MPFRVNSWQLQQQQQQQQQQHRPTCRAVRVMTGPAGASLMLSFTHASTHGSLLASSALNWATLALPVCCRSSRTSAAARSAAAGCCAR
jgi:hypothetical protein